MSARVVLMGRFPMGQIVATPGALQLLESVGVPVFALLTRHARGDWGDMCEEDCQLNERALASGARLLSSYRVGSEGENAKVWIITEADRSSTCILLPDEY